MSVLDTTVIPGLDAATYDQLATQLEPAPQAAPGVAPTVSELHNVVSVRGD